MNLFKKIKRTIVLVRFAFIVLFLFVGMLFLDGGNIAIDSQNMNDKSVINLNNSVMSMFANNEMDLVQNVEAQNVDLEDGNNSSDEGDSADSDNQDAANPDNPDKEKDQDVDGADEANDETDDKTDQDTNEDTEDTVPIPPDEDISVPGEKLFHIETHVGTQSVVNGNIPVFIYVKPYIDSSKAQLQWDVPRGLRAKSKTEQWFSMTEEESETFKLVISPVEPGKYEIIADMTAWRYDSNYVDSAQIEIEIDNNLLLTPRTSEYKRNQIIFTVVKVLGVIVGAFGAFILFKIGKKKFQKWMAED
jgi:hypothetical protein